MSAPSREAVEAALEAFYGKPSKTWFDWEREEMGRALTAALPHLKSPDPDAWVREILGRYKNDDINVHSAISEIEDGLGPEPPR